MLDRAGCDVSAGRDSNPHLSSWATEALPIELPALGRSSGPRAAGQVRGLSQGWDCFRWCVAVAFNGSWVTE